MIMRRELRIWFWMSASRLARVVERAAEERSARACGCDSCRLVYDKPFREQKAKDLIAEELRRRRATPAAEPGRSPS